MSEMSESESTEQEPVIVELSGRAVARQVMYDLQVDDVNRVGAVLQMTPVSAEGDAMERKASVQRRAEIEHLMPLFDHQARAVAAAALLASIEKLQEKHPGMEITEDLTVALYQQHKSIAFAAIFAGVSTLLSNGVIGWGTGK